MRPKISHTHPLTLRTLAEIKDVRVTQLIKASNRFLKSVSPKMTAGVKISELANSSLDGSTVITKNDSESIMGIRFIGKEIHFSVFDQWGKVRDILLCDDDIFILHPGSVSHLYGVELEGELEGEMAVIGDIVYKAVGVVIRLYTDMNYVPSDKVSGKCRDSRKTESLNDTRYKVITATKNWNAPVPPKVPCKVRGHYRLQPYGVGRKDTKKIFIKEHKRNALK